jgi:hypothetical protein
MKRIAALCLSVAAVLLSGCIKKFDTPEFVEVKANETAYVIPLEEGVKAGVKFDSEAYLDSKKVALKRVQIPHRWNQTGRWEVDGDWIDTVRVITVDRAPVTRQWNPGEKSKNALWMESADSIGFSTGFSVTAYIEEADTSRFLYSYKSTSLAQVLDEELRARIQSVAGAVAASFKMDDLRDKKNELIAKVRDDVLPFFKAKGITITTIGQFGGFEYENAEIQKAIDGTFIAQQVKVKNRALLEAQDDANKRTESEAKAFAQAARDKAQGDADGRLSVFKAEAAGIEAVNAALAKANQNPMLVQLKQIEVDKVRAEKWDGRYPQWYMGGSGQGPSMLLNVPAPLAVK